MIVLPIRTACVIRRTPAANYGLIAANVFLFFLFHERFTGGALAAFKEQHLFLTTHNLAIHKFFTYQFMHHDAMHLLGNMVFLWVFGNGVNAKMGNGPYLLFYLAGGAFAGWGHALMQEGMSALLGASGAIAAVTTAYLVLFPRSHVTVLIWFFFIHFIEVPAMLLIIIKVIVWDNVVGPALTTSQQVAHDAHLAGYFFGFVGAMFMLLLRGLPRDQFDILAVLKRWHQRRGFAAAMAEPGAAARAQYGTVARPVEFDPRERAREEALLDEIAALRGRIGDAFARGDIREAATLYEDLVEKSPGLCMSERQQLGIAREFYARQRYPQAAAAFDRYVTCYPQSSEASNVRLLLGIILARDLRDYERADRLLTTSMNVLRDDRRRSQCLQWLRDVRAALGRPAPEAPSG